jgi:hypothetical protein
MEEIAVHVNKALDYPGQAVIQKLREWWDDETGAGSANDPFSGSPIRGGFKVPVNVIQRGGYDSFEEMVTDIVPKVQALYEQRKASTE